MKPRVLIVDDSLTVRMDLSEAFDASGFAPARCSDLASARQAVAASAFALIVLDVLLPDGDGLEFLRELKGNSATADVPVLLLSTEAEVHDRIRGLQTGADDYVGKPYDAAYVVARAGELIRSAPPQQRAPSNTTVLIVDDSSTFREELKDHLEQAGYCVVAAATGEEALHIAIRERPAAIIVDSKLPGIDGRTVLRRIREDVILRRTPCLLLTGSEGRAEELGALESGADCFIHKQDGFPLVLARLAAILRLASSPPPPQTAKSVLGPKRILAVDDSAAYLNEVSARLREEGYEVVVAHSGDAAIELLAVQPADCILLDLMMPGLSGHEACRRIKSDPALRDIPVLILTAVEERASMVEGINAGADDYVRKSSEFEVLGARIRAALRRKQFEDENRHVHEEFLRKELEAADARAQRELAELRAALLHDLEAKHEELLRANAKLREIAEARALDQARLVMALDAGRIGTFECSLGENRVTWSPELERIHGLAPGSFRGTCEQWRNLIHPEDVDRVWKQICYCNCAGAPDGCGSGSAPAELVTDTEYRVVWPDGGIHWIVWKGRFVCDESGKANHIIGVAQDVTERKRSEQRQRDAHKLESVGLLAGGIAHDFNNLLAAIMGNASLLEYEVSYDGRGKLEAILQASERAADLTRQLLAYAGKGRFIVEPVAMSDLVKNMTELLHASIPKKVSVTRSLDPDLPPIEADPGQIQQIVMNLVLNAAESIPNEGALLIRTSVETVTEADNVVDEVSHERLVPGDYVCLEVRDTGTGIDPATKAKIFDPFFTTKFTGRGLGLPAAAGVVKAHRGAMQVVTEVGHGSTFRVFLPAAAPRDRKLPVSMPRDLRGSGTVLVADDEAMIREMATSALTKYGYTVLTANDGREAVQVFEQNAESIDLVLLDLTMPVMSGAEVLAALKQNRPNLKLILMSGYGESEAVRLFANGGISRFLQKPFTATVLAEQVKTALAGAPDRRS